MLLKLSIIVSIVVFHILDVQSFKSFLSVWKISKKV